MATLLVFISFSLRSVLVLHESQHAQKPPTLLLLPRRLCSEGILLRPCQSTPLDGWREGHILHATLVLLQLLLEAG